MSTPPSSVSYTLSDQLVLHGMSSPSTDGFNNARTVGSTAVRTRGAAGPGRFNPPVWSNIQSMDYSPYSSFEIVPDFSGIGYNTGTAIAGMFLVAGLAYLAGF